MSKRNYRSAVVQDTTEPLGEIRDRNATAEKNIVSAVLDIQKHAITRNSWIKSLECLYLATDHTDHDSEPTGKRQRLDNGDSLTSSFTPELLRRTYLDPVSDPQRGREYVAVSYTWDFSEAEEEEESCHSYGGYFIESRKAGEPAQPSEVRDLVWERVLQYAEHVKCDAIWIDRECVDQDNAREKETAIQNMHLVYSLSRRPIGLLTHVITTKEELHLLVSLLLGDIRAGEEDAVLDLLEEITSDLWWQRAWTFQEDYRASTRMSLLIPHTSNLENRKQTARDYANRPLLGTLPGEICIKSTEFRRQATEFCLLYRRKRPETEPRCNKILRAAGKYNVLLREESSTSPHTTISRSMTPTIFVDIGRRGIFDESDRLAIAANCCGYTTRLDTVALNQRGSSLSLSMLALYLLNGEIMENHPRCRRGTLKDTIFKYLEKQSLQSFRPPVDEELTFIKGCRFVDPVLTSAGTLTRGHLWRLGKVIRPRPLKREKYSTLPPLEVLATDLYDSKYGAAYTDLAINLLSWTQEYSPTNRKGKQHRYHGRSSLARTPPWGYRAWMADEVDAALMEGKALRLAVLVDREYEKSCGATYSAPYSAIFVGEDEKDWPEEDKDNRDTRSRTSYVFTSVRPPKPNSRIGDTPKHVSLEVDVEWPEPEPKPIKHEYEREHDHENDTKTPETTTERGSGTGLPKLYVKRWLNGLCFAGGQAQQQVLFPWPADLLAMPS